ncbi:MAG: hypothetical protein GWN07_40565 [Actinobacteria bacterium]|nr:hypothetical protein [Actinomycetota bacterium]NIU71727.1 hypothetical protein [Actinomycetota bacterium]NIW33674.1 hypothetical protein [Actinomycetota bacterium]NIX25769.1 hypothetical protein [Actinomycetota bacterium]
MSAATPVSASSARRAIRRLAVIALAALVTACGGGPDLEGYFDQVAEIGRVQNIRSAAIAGATPDRDDIAEIVDLRRDGLRELRAIEAPDDVAGLHNEFVGAFERVVTLAEAFLRDTEGLDDRAFTEALSASVEIDEAQRRFSAFCRALEIEAAGLGVPDVDLSC